jgi:hypothetical protein
VSTVETMWSKLLESGRTSLVRQRIIVTERKAGADATHAARPDAGT